MLNQRPSSGALIGEDERCVNRSMSTAVANVLNAQNAVASCIRGMGVISGCIWTTGSITGVLIWTPVSPVCFFLFGRGVCRDFIIFWVSLGFLHALSFCSTVKMKWAGVGDEMAVPWRCRIRVTRRCGRKWLRLSSMCSVTALGIGGFQLLVRSRTTDGG